MGTKVALPLDDINEIKKEIKKQLVDAIITGLESKRLSLIDMKTSANYILDNIDAIDDYNKCILFLEQIQSRWPLFTPLYQVYKNKFYEQKEKAVIDKLTQYISHIKSN